MAEEVDVTPKHVRRSTTYVRSYVHVGSIGVDLDLRVHVCYNVLEYLYMYMYT